MFWEDLARSMTVCLVSDAECVQQPKKLGSLKGKIRMSSSLSLCAQKGNFILKFLCLLFESHRMYFMVCLLSGTGKRCCE